MKIAKEALDRAAEAVRVTSKVNKWVDGRSREEHIAEAAIQAAAEPDMYQRGRNGERCNCPLGCDCDATNPGGPWAVIKLEA